MNSNGNSDPASARSAAALPRVVALDATAVEDAIPLFASYPFKNAQRIAQRLDRDRLNAFYAEGLRRSVAAGSPAWIASDPAWREAGPVALGGLAPDAWHSEIYGIRLAKIQPWLNALDPPAGEALLDAVLERARADGVERLSVRLDGEDYRNLHLFERRGFLTIDVSMKFSRPMPFAPDVVPAARDDWRIRLSSDDDVAWMRELGAKEHAGTHYLNDPELPRAKTEELFGRWVEKCARGLAYRIYVLEAASGRPAGFVIYLRNPGFARAVGPSPVVLDYVILSPAARGGGVGTWFVQETLKREADSGFSYCELRTSQHNHAAMATYEKLGFRVCATDFVLHGPPGG